MNGLTPRPPVFVRFGSILDEMPYGPSQSRPSSETESTTPEKTGRGKRIIAGLTAMVALGGAAGGGMLLGKQNGDQVDLSNKQLTQERDKLAKENAGLDATHQQLEGEKTALQGTLNQEASKLTKAETTLAELEKQLADLQGVQPPTDPSAPSGSTKVIDADLLRVGISDTSMTKLEYKLTRISGTGGITIADQANQQVFKGEAGEQVVVRVDASGFTLTRPDGESIATQVKGPLKVTPATPQDKLQIDSIKRREKTPRYHGTFEIIRGGSASDKLSVVNVVPMQEYLQAVVPSELPSSFGLQAVRAQAVAARNYALRPRDDASAKFDICDSQACQVYSGSQIEDKQTNRAILETQGQMALYKGEPILAMYSSASGGHTESYANAFSDPKTGEFPAKPIPYLTGGPDIGPKVDLSTEEAARKFWTNSSVATYDVDSPHYRWEKEWTATELAATLDRTLADLSQDGYTGDFVSPQFKPGDSIGELKNVTVAERGVSGKAMVIEIEGTNGTWTIQKESLIRTAFTHKGERLPSANVVFTPKNDASGKLQTLVVNGGGIGHGVGMSQLGASWMDKHGQEYPAILQHYYKGVSIGSRPLEVGKGGHNQPVQTQFYSKDDKGKLLVEAGKSDEPVHITLNGKELTVEGPMAVDLKAGELNTLILHPDSQKPDRPIKAWVDLYAAKA